MCNCENGQFEIYNNELHIWDDEYQGFYKASKNCYKYCPICGENLQPERASEKTRKGSGALNTTEM